MVICFLITTKYQKSMDGNSLIYGEIKYLLEIKIYESYLSTYLVNQQISCEKKLNFLLIVIIGIILYILFILCLLSI